MEQEKLQPNQTVPNPKTAQWHNGLWHTYNDHLAKHFGEKVYKITVSAGFTCPTRDGTRGSKGCAFCDERGSSSFFATGQASLNIRQQIEAAKPRIAKRFNAKKFLAYFQSFTNTYGPLKYLQEVYDGAINVDDVVGMAIGTRPDCVPSDVLNLLNNYGRDRYVSLELGLQSFRNDVLEFYDRGHSVEEGIDAVERAMRFPNLSVAVHLMFGSEPEMRDPIEMQIDSAIAAAKRVNALKVHGVKVHQLMILKDTVLATRFAINPWPLYTMHDYNRILIAFLEHLDPKIHVERTHALSSHAEELVGPAWAAGRFDPQNHLRASMTEMKTYQGRLFSTGAIQ